LSSVYSKEAVQKKTVIRPYDGMMNKSTIYEQSLGMETIVSFMAIYIGIVFLITSAAVLALQQLSEASDNVERYGLLRKLGTEEKMISRALFEQIGIYFFLPLSLAVVHSIVGIRVANNAITIIGHLDTAGSTLFTAAVFLLIYGGYFIATYFGSRSMICQRS
jgi:putative ABC transport system permease protein